MEKKDLSNLTNEYDIKITIYDNYGGYKIYEEQRSLSKLFNMLDKIGEKFGFSTFDEYFKYKFYKADEELQNFIRTIKVKLGLVK